MNLKDESDVGAVPVISGCTIAVGALDIYIYVYIYIYYIIHAQIKYTRLLWRLKSYGCH